MTGLISIIGGVIAAGAPAPGFIVLEAGGGGGVLVIGEAGVGLNVGVIEAMLPAAPDPAAVLQAHSEYVPSS
jgi:hypothetical protein